MDPIQTTALAGSVAAYEMSMWHLFLRADVVVKLVMVALAVSSFWCWTIIFEKVLRIRRIHQRTEQFEEAFWSGGSLDALYDGIGNRPQDPMTAVFAAAMAEWRRSLAKGRVRDDAGKQTLKERTERVMAITVTREMERLERHMTFLASVGSTAPFVGLFGTVWGIMNSFQSIAVTKNVPAARREGLTRGGTARQEGPVAPAAHVRDQRDAPRGRHARASHHLHGHGAAAHRGRAC
jgi:biopolymer transport protein TolQ